MKTFIRVVELWVPDRTRTRLEFGGSLCRAEFSEFKAVSENALFAYGEGCPARRGPPAAFLCALDQFEDHRERGPVRQTALRSDGAVAKVLSMGLVVRQCFQCSAGK